MMWFVNGLYIGETSSDERMWWMPSVGRHEVVVIDEAGASATRWFEVRQKL
jgi:membrane carboxypeptidase/penicillin-binding protein PbpC